MNRTILRSLLAGLAVAVLALTARAAKEFVMPPVNPARTYAAHDEHPMERVTVAIEPYDTPAKSKTFHTDFLKHGLMPMFVVVTNDGDAPIALTGIKVQLQTRDQTKYSPADGDDVLRRITNTRKLQSESTGAQRFPIPLPKKAAGANSREALDEVTLSQFQAKAIEPHTSHAGFFFFDTSGLDDPLRGATLYITGVKGADGNELMYFEVNLTKYLEKREPI